MIDAYNQKKDALERFKDKDSQQYKSAKRDFDSEYQDIEFVIRARDRLVTNMAKQAVENFPADDFGEFNQYLVTEEND